MLQVGVDVQRLGLTRVVGQPKNTAEYIQASSRVDRAPAARPGLVVSLGERARPRDLAHLEQCHELQRNTSSRGYMPHTAKDVGRTACPPRRAIPVADPENSAALSKAIVLRVPSMVCRKYSFDRRTVAAYVALNTTNSGPNYTASRDVILLDAPVRGDTWPAMPAIASGTGALLMVEPYKQSSASHHGCRRPPR
jgi:hypothetical protein